MNVNMQLGARLFQLFGKDWKRAFDFAGDLGLQSIQIDRLDESDLPLLQEQMDRTGIRISSISAMSWKMLGPDLNQALTDQESVKRQISFAGRLGVPLVSQFAGNDPSKTFRENVALFQRIFRPLVSLAEDSGVALVVENCPLIDGTPPVVRNFAYSPASWDAILEAIPSPSLGLEFDTAHLPFLGIDPIRCIREYKDKIFHVHFKDCRLLPEEIYRHGTIGEHHYRYEVPGDGDVDFAGIIGELTRAGYEGDVTLDLRPTTEETLRRGAVYIHALLKQENEGVTQ